MTNLDFMLKPVEPSVTRIFPGLGQGLNLVPPGPS